MEGESADLLRGGIHDALGLDEDDDDDDLLAQQVLFSTPKEDVARRRGGSQPGKRANKDRDFQARYKRFVQQYFAPNSVYDELDFRRRNRMSKPLFSRVLDGVLEADPQYFEQRPDATKRMGIHPMLKVTSALRVLAYAMSADALDENLEMSDTVIYNNVTHFVEAVDKQFGSEYLRSPNETDMQRLLQMNARRGFVGMWCSIDCMHWEWQNCPSGWAGQFKGKEKKPTVVLEACADQELWIWHASFGWPGSLNDLNILDRSPVFDDLMNGTAPRVNFKINGHEYNMAYCLADGIYPDWAVFIKTLSQPRGNKQKKIAAVQEALRKDVERAFGVLQARWRILAVPCKLHSRLDMEKVMRACIILHNMICEENRNSNVDEHNYLFDESDESSVYTLKVTRPAGFRPRSIGELTSRINAIESATKHAQLRADLIEHVWNCFGDEI
ncbi:hypothetical protein PR002_g30841 [Phytophthora rubi]|uniref:DDE Tnp4 domain-containing protein n=1 Tax=Phytophthora rubi TaxID=129364 RepID=A0A6A3GPE6_9STRA|nr:hypothetical protein PR002_g30841 [Phytophthora rubi]